MNKKVGLAIVTYGTNYGTYLQAFATQYFINKLGYDTEVINIESVEKEVSSARKKYFISRLLSYSELKSYFHVILGIVKEKTNKPYRTFIGKRKTKMEEFKKEKFVFSNKCDSFNGLSAYCRDNYDSVVVGSDQLWRPANIAGNFYTLNFVPDEVNKIAYATSFGLKQIRDNQIDIATRFLSRINHLSVRESSGAEIVDTLIKRKIPVVLDPTLLLTKDEWSIFAASEIETPDKYILCYFLGSNKSHRDFSVRLAKETGCKIVSLVHIAGYMALDKGFGDLQPANVGPCEFLALVKNAQYVCTDSFHGCVFATQFERPLFAFKRFSNKDKMSTNDRISTLLKMLNMEERLVYGTEDCREYIDKAIDYSKAKELLDNRRKESVQYLENAFANVNTDLN